MGIKHLVVALAGLLAGCTSVEDIAARPARGSAIYRASYDTMAYCLESQAGPLIRGRARIYPTQRRATVGFGDIYGTYTVWLYEIQQINDTDVEVAWKQQFHSSPDPSGKELPDKCVTRQ